MFEFNAEVTVGNLVAIIAAVISAAAVIMTLDKERALRKKELADRVRQATALVIAKLDRWKQIALQAFDQLEAAATEADGRIVLSRDEIATRDFFWQHAVAAQASLAKSILDEEIEVAYSGLYGYDPRIHELFLGVTARLRHIGGLVFLQLLNRTQHDILTLRAGGSETIVSAQLGNRLRFTLAQSRTLLEAQMESVLVEFRNGVTGIVRASDDELVRRTVAIPSPAILPSLQALEQTVYETPSGEIDSCLAFLTSIVDSRLGAEVPDPWPLGIRFPEDAEARGRPAVSNVSQYRHLPVDGQGASVPSLAE